MDDDRVLWAHSRNNRGVRHALDDHLRGTAELARGFAEVFGAGELAGYLGLTHDVGKAACVWQEGLERAERTAGRVGVDHKTVGAWLAAQQVGAFALAVQGHHGSLPGRAELKRLLPEAYRQESARFDEAVERVAALIPEVRPSQPVAFPAWYGEGDAVELVTDLLVRLVASALFDADFLDTERHFAGEEVVRSFASTSPEELFDRYERGRVAYLAERDRSPIDGIREDLYAHAVAAADGPGGIYRMPAPTGSGKTIAAGGFALAHARRRGLRRVVVAVPFISITEQNAGVYRRLLAHSEDHPLVLEHHSSVDADPRASGLSGWQRLAAENWDAPFVVTTTVQLFHSLFSNRPSAMRKLHRLARSVIVLDEVQALPDRLLLPILSALRSLSACFGTTVLLASATQPEFWELTALQDVARHEVVPDPARMYAALRRVRYTWWLDPKPTLAEVADAVAAEPQVLTVVNTTRDAATLHELVEDVRDDALGPVYHLSTRMAAQHRKDVLAAITERLGAGEPVAVVSTQLVEAGVDVDFPVVYRALAPADSILQAAGRANRNGRLSHAERADGGRVVIFDPVDGGQPRDAFYRAALNPTARHFGPLSADPEDRDALAAYYRDRYDLQGLAGNARSTPHPRHPAAEIERDRRELDFPAVAEKFDFFADEHTRQVVITGYGDETTTGRIEASIYHLRTAKPPRRWAFRALQPYLATVPRGLIGNADRRGWVELVIGDLLVWRGPYHPQRGVQVTEGPEEYVW